MKFQCTALDGSACKEKNLRGAFCDASALGSTSMHFQVTAPNLG